MTSLPSTTAHSCRSQITRSRGSAWQAGPLAPGSAIVAGMTAQPAMPDPDDAYQVIHLGGQEAAIVPLGDLRRLQAVERLAPAEVIESAEIETTLAVHREWVAAGRPGAVSHDEAMAELLADL